jgi:hypothetical protein
VSASERAVPAPQLATLIDEYRVRLEDRFRDLRQDVRERIEATADRQAAGRSQPRPAGSSPIGTGIAAGAGAGAAAAEVVTLAAGFSLPGFRDWFDDRLTEVVADTPADVVANGGRFEASYTEQAYVRGLRFGSARLREAGYDPYPTDFRRRNSDSDYDIDFDRLRSHPEHGPALRSLYDRQYTELRGVSDYTRRQVARVLSEAVAEGTMPAEAADRLAEEIRTIQHTRARAIARTELPRSHHLASIERYREAGVVEVDIYNPSPCPDCRDVIEENPYSVREASAILLVHPFCLCVAIPT